MMVCVLMKLHVAALRAAFANGRGFFQKPSALFEAKVFQGQRSRRTNVGVVARIIGFERTTVDRGDFRIVSALNGHHLVNAGDLVAEANATRAVNAAIHVLLDDRAHIEIEISASFFGIARVSVAVSE